MTGEHGICVFLSGPRYRDEFVAEIRHPERAAYVPLFRDETAKGWGTRVVSAVKRPARSWRFVFFFEDEVGGSGAGGDLDPVGNAGGYVDDVSGVQGNLFSAFDPGAEGLTGCG